MRNYRPRPEMPWPDGWNASRSSLLPATSSPIPERLNACVFAPTIGTQVWKSKKHKTASYGGLQTCGSVWVCPVCGAKVVERRRGEIQQAMAQHRACGGEVHLLTLTAPHTRFDVLEELQAKLGKALNGFLADKTVKKIFKEMGYIGQIRGYEVTHGRKGTNNGWHPHFHFLQFVQVKGAAASSWTGKRGFICGGMPTAKRPGLALHPSSMALTCVTEFCEQLRCEMGP